MSFVKKKEKDAFSRVKPQSFQVNKYKADHSMWSREIKELLKKTGLC